ncbi:hypothetical protein, conserved [Eimeria tenella]|uniref:Uncharacterized protein n=1 Tax=Eimeria tenella TaxID=5802 RepID=U6KHQ2_EIMTE|nr:hypothetical protein, conserved [Eimeria tenella]CDJ37555.1 hypothetical protein, conserved [Eimeria tenella]|eukprot:XP_013228393.1 hypothetical protein, conserved [Eimeria tenella]
MCDRLRSAPQGLAGACLPAAVLDSRGLAGSSSSAASAAAASHSANDLSGKDPRSPTRQTSRFLDPPTAAAAAAAFTAGDSAGAACAPLAEGFVIANAETLQGSSSYETFTSLRPQRAQQLEEQLLKRQEYEALVACSSLSPPSICPQKCECPGLHQEHAQQQQQQQRTLQQRPQPQMHQQLGGQRQQQQRQQKTRQQQQLKSQSPQQQQQMQQGHNAHPRQQLPEHPQQQQQQQQQQPRQQDQRQQQQTTSKGGRRRTRRGGQRQRNSETQGGPPQGPIADSTAPPDFPSAAEGLIKGIDIPSSSSSSSSNNTGQWSLHAPLQTRSSPVGAMLVVSPASAAAAAAGGPPACLSEQAVPWGFSAGAPSSIFEELRRAPQGQRPLHASSGEEGAPEAVSQASLYYGSLSPGQEEALEGQQQYPVAPGAPLAAQRQQQQQLLQQQHHLGISFEEQVEMTRLVMLHQGTLQWEEAPIQMFAPEFGGLPPGEGPFTIEGIETYGAPSGPQLPPEIPPLPKPEEEAPEWADEDGMAVEGGPRPELLGAPMGGPPDEPVEASYAWPFACSVVSSHSRQEPQQASVAFMDTYELGSDSSCSCCHYDCSSRGSEDDSRRSSCSSISCSGSNPSEEESNSGDSGDGARLAPEQQRRVSDMTSSKSTRRSSRRRSVEAAATDHWKLQRGHVTTNISEMSSKEAAAASKAAVSAAAASGRSLSPECSAHSSWSSPMARSSSNSSSSSSSSSKDHGSCSSKEDDGSSRRERASRSRRRRPLQSGEASREFAHEGLKRLRRGPRLLQQRGGPPAPSGPPQQLGRLGPVHERMVIFDWDDTFFPNSWIASRGLSLVSDPSEYAADLPLLQRLTQSSRKVLLAAREIGRVVLITNAAQGWIDETCKRFLPGLWPLVETLRRTSARFLFDSPSTESPFVWKRLAFKEEVDRHLREHKCCRTILSIGDGPHERDALFFLCESAAAKAGYDFTCKSLKLMDMPSLKHLNIQHSLLLHTLDYLLGHDGHLDLCVRAPPSIEAPVCSEELDTSYEELPLPASERSGRALRAAADAESNFDDPVNAAVRLLNLNWRRCSRGAASLLHIDHHSSLTVGCRTAMLPQ